MLDGFGGMGYVGGLMRASAAFQLKSKTHPDWVKGILKNFDAFLADHADCEKKASAMAMHFVSKYPDRVELHRPMIDLALEELQHFKQVYLLLRKRNAPLLDCAIHDPYVNGLLVLCRHGRDERLLDRLLIVSIVETRGAERFRIVSQALKDPELKKFYRTLYSAEARHGNLFVVLAQKYFSGKVIKTRLEELLTEEARLVDRLEWRPSLH